MPIRHQDLREYVIRPVLRELELYSDRAEALLIGTAAAESRLGEYLQQVRGPAQGLYQMEPDTHDDIWVHYLSYRPELAERVRAWTAPHPWQVDQLRTNLAYATVMARIHYLRVPAPLPAADDLDGQAAYWKQHYNTPAGRGTPAHYVRAWQQLVEAD